MMGLLAVGLLQDFIQVFGVGLFPVPDLILFLLLYRLVGQGHDLVRIIWTACLAGLLWDLRWASFAGLSSLFYLTAVVAFFVAWTNVPASGRTPFLALIFLVMAQFIVAFGRLCFTFGQDGMVLQFFLIQQVIALPVAGMVACLIGKHLDGHE